MRLLTVTRYLVFVALLISQLSVSIARAETAAEPVSGDVSDARLRSVEASGEGANWLAHGRGYGEQRYSPLGQIDNGNVAQLGLAWSFDVGNRFVMQTTPLAIDGVLYFTAAWSVVHALDAKTGEELCASTHRSRAKRATAIAVGFRIAAWPPTRGVSSLGRSTVV